MGMPEATRSKNKKDCERNSNTGHDKTALAEKKYYEREAEIGELWVIIRREKIM